MQRWVWTSALLAPLALVAALQLNGDAAAQPRPEPPHAWVFGSWTGGIFPPGDTTNAECTGSPTVIFTRDVVMRATALDTQYRQRVIETVAQQPNGLEFRFTPLGQRVPPDYGFGCPGGTDALRVERRGPDEIVFPNCSEFPSPLKRCGAATR